jgi:hypothetical protein
LKVSEEFNGDMAPNMVKGKKVLKKLRAAETQDHFEKVVWETICDFDYQDYYESEDPADALDSYDLQEHIGTAADNPFAFTKEVLSRMFNYSDFAYIVPYRHPLYIVDANGKALTIQPRQVAVFGFGELEKVYNQKKEKYNA